MDDPAIAALLAGDVARAAELLAGQIEERPGDPEVLSNYGAALQGLGRVEEAAARYREAIEAGGEPAGLLWYNLGSARGELGDAAGAEEAYRRAAELDPDLREARTNLGVLLFGQGRLAEAEVVLEEATRVDPHGAHVRCNLGAVRCARGDLEGAEAVYREATQLEPDSVAAHVGLGATLAVAGNPEASVAALERALAVEPESTEARRQLAAVLSQSGMPERAEEVYRSLTERRPDDGWAANGLGTVLEAVGRSDEARAAFARATRLAPDWADAHYNLGVNRERAGDSQAAEIAYRAALERDPEHLLATKNLAGLLRGMARVDEAADCYRRALELAPGDRPTEHLLAAMTGQTTERAPDEYVREVFDAYAPRYSEHMVGALGYKAPQAIAAALAELVPGRRFARAVDLGCGTGLVGRTLRAAGGPSAVSVDRLEGVDLAPAMLAEAEAGGGYDALARADVVEHLRAAEPGQYDLALAADVLIYVGELAPLFDALAHALAPGGLWVFTVEVLEDAARADYRLRDTARYAHARGYLERLATRRQMRCLGWRDVDLREERGEPVPGVVGVMAAAG